MILILKHTKG